MGNDRWYDIECYHRIADPELKRLKVAALNLWEASRLSFDRPLPGKPPTQPPLPFSEKAVFHITSQSQRGEGKSEGSQKYK
jgi:hypothetical protein